MLVFIAWLTLAALAWPSAVLVVAALLLIWLLSIPFRSGPVMLTGAIDLVNAAFPVPGRIARG